MKPKQPAVYIMASKLNGTLYIGVTSNLLRRTFEHQQKVMDGFTKRYTVGHLVYYEFHSTMLEVIKREKQIKKWNRAWKIRLIQEFNLSWKDLSEEIGL